MKKKTFISTILLFIMVPSVIFASGYSFTGYKWPKEFNKAVDIKMKYSTIIPNTAKNAFDTAVTDWNNAQSKIKFNLSASNSTSLNVVTSQNVADQTLYGECDIYATTSGAMTKFTAYVNIGNNSNTSNSSVARSTAVHELAHAVGLDHVSPVYIAVMNSSRDRAVIFKPQTNDVNGINALYP